VTLEQIADLLKTMAHTLAAATNTIVRVNSQVELLRSDLHAARNEIQELNERLDANDRIERECR